MRRSGRALRLAPLLVGVYGNFEKLALIVKKLTEVEDDLDKECAAALKVFELHKCKKDFTYAENAKAISENEGRIEVLESDRDALEIGNDLTDERAQYDHQIQAKEVSMKVAIKAKDAAKTDCDNKANKASEVISGLTIFLSKLQASTFLQKGDKPRELLSHMQLVTLGKHVSTEQMETILRLEKDAQAPEAYKSSRGALNDLVAEIKTTWTKKSQDDASICRQDQERRAALIQDMEKDIQALEGERATGADEKAAKAEAKASLNEEIKSLQDANAKLQEQNTKIDTNYKAQATEYYGAEDAAGCQDAPERPTCKECEMQKAALKRGIEYMKSDEVKRKFGENQRNIGRTSVAAEEGAADFLQLATAQSPLMLLRTAITSQVGEKRKEMAKLKAEEEACYVGSHKDLANAKLLSEKMDVYALKINDMVLSITEASASIDKYVKEMKEAVEGFAKKWKGFVEEYKVEAERRKGLVEVLAILEQLENVLRTEDGDSVAGTTQDNMEAQRGGGITALITSIEQGFDLDLQKAEKSLYDIVSEFGTVRQETGFKLMADASSFPDLASTGNSPKKLTDVYNKFAVPETGGAGYYYIQLPKVDPLKQGAENFDVQYQPQKIYNLLYTGETNGKMDASKANSDTENRKFYCVNDDEEEAVAIRVCDDFDEKSVLADYSDLVETNENKKSEQQSMKALAVQQKANLQKELDSQITAINTKTPACDFFMIRGKDKQGELQSEVGVLLQAATLLKQLEHSQTVGNATDITLGDNPHISTNAEDHVGNSREYQDAVDMGSTTF